MKYAYFIFLLGCVEPSKEVTSNLIPEEPMPQHGDVPPYEKAIQNPIASNGQSIHRGKSAFKKFCMECHGEFAKGDGPRAHSLNIKPSNIPELIKTRSDYEVFLQMSLGSLAMPQQRASLGEEDRWNIVNYLRTIPQ